VSRLKGKEQRTEEKGHVLLKELRSNTREASVEGDERSITKKTKADASKKK